jgi:hypothetical protein
MPKEKLPQHIDHPPQLLKEHQEDLKSINDMSSRKEERKDETTTTAASSSSTNSTSPAEHNAQYRQTVNRALDETKSNIRRSTDEARREIPRYT